VKCSRSKSVVWSAFLPGVQGKVLDLIYGAKLNFIRRTWEHLCGRRRRGLRSAMNSEDLVNSAIVESDGFRPLNCSTAELSVIRRRRFRDRSYNGSSVLPIASSITQIIHHRTFISDSISPLSFLQPPPPPYTKSLNDIPQIGCVTQLNVCWTASPDVVQPLMISRAFCPNFAMFNACRSHRYQGNSNDMTIVRLSSDRAQN
jgi:hypothetical protein